LPCLASSPQATASVSFNNQLAHAANGLLPPNSRQLAKAFHELFNLIPENEPIGVASTRSRGHIRCQTGQRRSIDPTTASLAAIAVRPANVATTRQSLQRAPLAVE
jgi:hypothetical protein